MRKARGLDFHFQIVRGSRNQMLMDLLGSEQYQLLRMCRYRTSRNAQRTGPALQQHRQIVAALAQRDGELAEMLMATPHPGRMAKHQRNDRQRRGVRRMNNTPGNKLRHAVEQNHPLQVVGAVTAYCAILAQKSGHKALYLSGGGVAASSLGIPDLGITTLHDVCEDTRRITAASDLPLLVDIDTGWGGAFNIARATREIAQAGAAGFHIEDQVMQKRCGIAPTEAIVSKDEMADRIKAAVDARSNESFVIMARTDALAVEGMQSAIDRAQACVGGRCDMIFRRR